MTVNDVLLVLNRLAPKSLSTDYDNVGLLVGDGSDVVAKILVVLDCTSEVIDEAAQLGANLIVTHHPVIYTPQENVTAENRVYKLIRNGISVISVHTNLDMAEGGVNDCLCAALDLSDISVLTDDETGFSSRIGSLKAPLTAKGLAEHAKGRLGGIERYVDGGKMILRVAVCGGTGGKMVDSAILAGADALVTADVKHSMFISAAERGFTLIDAGHFHTEDVVVEPLADYLRSAVGDILVVTSHTTPIRTL